MKKILPICITSVSLIAIAAGVAATLGNRVSGLKATNGEIELTMTYDSIIDYDEYVQDGYHYCDFIVTTKTLSGDDFGAMFETYALNKASVLDNDHILELDGGDYGYSQINVEFEFADITSYQKVTLHGNFDFAYSEDTNHITENATANKASFNIYGLSSCYISSITITYHC